jgi:integrase
VAYTEKRKGGWRVRWQLPDGRYASKDGFATKREAKEHGETQEAEIRTGTWVNPKKGEATVDEWWQRWFPAQDLAPNTLDNYAQQYKCHIKPRWGNVRLAEVAALDVQRFEKDLRGRLASATVVVIMSVFNRMMNDAAFERVIAFSPIAPGKRSRRNSITRPTRSGIAVGLETVEAIRARLRPDDALLVLVAAFTGMRWGEICGMRRSYLTLHPAQGEQPAYGHYTVDPVLGAVHETVRAHRYYGPPKTVLKNGKGREIDLPPFLVELLIDFVEAMGERDLLFPNRKGEPRRHTDWLRVWRRACDGWHARIDQRTGKHTPGAEPVCETLRFHDLRHSHKTMMIALGVEEIMQDNRLGHTPRGVQGVYSHPTKEMRIKLVEGLEHAWRGFQEHAA